MYNEDAQIINSFIHKKTSNHLYKAKNTGNVRKNKTTLVKKRL